MIRSTLNTLYRIFIEPPQSYDTAIHHKSRLLSIFLLVMIFVFTAVDVTYVMTVPGYTVPWYGYVFLLISYVLNRWQYYSIAAVLVVFMFPAVIFFSIFSGQANNPVVSLSFLVLGLIVASILLSPRGVVFLAFVNLFGILLLLRLMPQTFPNFSVIIVPLAALTISAALLLISMWHRDQVESDRQALLRLSEERYRMLFEEAPDGILIVDGINRIVMANSVIYEMTGYTSKELIGRSPLDFVAPEDLSDRPPRPFEEIKVPGSMRRERTLIHKNGSRLNVVISSSYMPDGHLQYIIQDITERKRIEDALRASEEKFAKAFQSSPDTLAISLIDTGKIIEVNDGFLKMSGYTREEAIGRTAQELNFWEDMNERKKMLDILQRDGKVRDFEVIARRKSGELVNILVSAEIIEVDDQKCIVVMSRDITERKRMEEELRLSEERYRLVSSVVSDYIYSTVRDENDHWLQNWVAGAFERITGYTLEEFNGRGGWISILHPDDVEKDADAMRKLLNNEQTVAEPRIIHKDRSVHWVRSYAHPVWDEQQNRLVEIYGAVQDITEQKRIEQELLLSEERYRLVSSVISDYIFSVVVDEKGELNLNWLAGAFEQITGFTLEEFNERGGWLSILHPADREKDRQDIANLRNNRRVVSEIRLIHKDGSTRWVRSYGHPVWDEEKSKLVGIYGAVQDITEQKRIEQELRLSEERYRLVSSVISDYTFSNIQNEKGEIVLNWVAGAFEQISGYTFDEFNARGGWASTVHPDDLEQDARDMEMLRNNQKVISELRTIHKDGTIRWVKSYADPVWDEEKDQLAGLYGAVQDITERKRIEYERESLIKDLEAKNQELEHFTYTVSHDLKAPIITIKGFLGFLGADALAGDKKRLEADIQRINDATDKMNELLNDLLELSRIGRKMNAPEMISFVSLVNEVIETTHGRLQAGRVDLIVKGPFPNVYGDRGRLLEVVQNLVDNAAKFMGDQPSPRIEIGQDGRAEDGYATFFVRDNGIGIAPEFHERIFGLFNRLNPKIEGTGIGLALVKRIVEFHGGRVWIQGEEGNGTTFYFTLPNAPVVSV